MSIYVYVYMSEFNVRWFYMAIDFSVILETAYPNYRIFHLANGLGQISFPQESKFNSLFIALLLLNK